MALRKPRDQTIVNRFILLILTCLRSFDRGNFLFARNQILSVLRYTLYGNCSNGRRPDFFESAKGAKAEKIYDKFVSEVKKELGDDRVQTGQFAAYMTLSLVNDGPVTLVIDGKSG